MKAIKFKYYRILCRIVPYNISKHIVLEYAKEHYLDNKDYQGMCNSIEIACAYFGIYPTSVRYFAQFNPKFCEADNPNFTYGVYWWNVRRKEPRIKAFDKLIKYYKEHKEYI